MGSFTKVEDAIRCPYHIHSKKYHTIKEGQKELSAFCSISLPDRDSPKKRGRAERDEESCELKSGTALFVPWVCSGENCRNFSFFPMQYRVLSSMSYRDTLDKGSRTGCRVRQYLIDFSVHRHGSAKLRTSPHQQNDSLRARSGHNNKNITTQTQTTTTTTHS